MLLVAFRVFDVWLYGIDLYDEYSIAPATELLCVVMFFPATAVTMRRLHDCGWQGWPAKGPFNGIIVTAAAARVPEALLTQLANEGVLIAPIGEKEQQLIIVQRQGDNFVHHQLESVRFVPLIVGVIE